MRVGESLSAALGANSELPHRCRESCNFSFAEREEPPRDTLLQEFSHSNGPNFYRVNRLLVIHDAVFWDVGGDFLRFRQRPDALIIIELFRGYVLGDGSNAVPWLFQNGGPGTGRRLPTRVTSLFKGVLDAVLEPLKIEPIFASSGAPLQ